MIRECYNCGKKLEVGVDPYYKMEISTTGFYGNKMFHDEAVFCVKCEKAAETLLNKIRIPKIRG